ncbi:hypothetical protein OXYTRIMIC_256 [Oxytricha trifallax]|uniref:Uncharacterized protein n=1 Tax=Oxytricha trifallax TaxID=1172189 RepID=A0A073HZB5_9SPIT|nr:hypothetical protein OXYTRIMIC_256 [Oxytricha trifallax]
MTNRNLKQERRQLQQQIYELKVLAQDRSNIIRDKDVTILKQDKTIDLKKFEIEKLSTTIIILQDQLQELQNKESEAQIFKEKYYGQSQILKAIYQVNHDINVLRQMSDQANESLIRKVNEACPFQFTYQLKDSYPPLFLESYLISKTEEFSETYMYNAKAIHQQNLKEILDFIQISLTHATDLRQIYGQTIDSLNQNQNENRNQLIESIKEEINRLDIAKIEELIELVQDYIDQTPK